jgi:transposase
MARDADDRLKIIQYYRETKSVPQTCARFSLARQTLYNWLERLRREGEAGLVDKSRAHHSHPQKTATGTTQHIVELALTHPTLGGTELAKMIVSLHSRVSPQTVNSVLRSKGLSTGEARILQLEQIYHWRPELTAFQHPWAKLIKSANPRYRDCEMRGALPGEGLAFGIVAIDGFGTFNRLWLACVVDTYSNYVHASVHASRPTTDAFYLLEEAMQHYSKLGYKTSRIRIHTRSFSKEKNIAKLKKYAMDRGIIRSDVLFEHHWKASNKRSGFVLHLKKLIQESYVNEWDRRQRPSLSELRDGFGTWLRDFNQTSALPGYPTMDKSPQMMIAAAEAFNLDCDVTDCQDA